jgi:hypothetical protein
MEKLVEIIKHWVIPLFLIISLLLIVFLIFKRIYYQYKLPYKHRIIRKSEKFLTEITLSKPDKNTLRYKVAQFKTEIPIHKTWCKEMLIADMIRMKSNLKGKTAKNILLIYKELDLNHYSARLIRDFRNYKKCEGIYHFHALGYKPGIFLLKKYLFYPNKIVQSNANIAFLALTKGDWQALDKIPVKVSIRTTIKVMDVLYSEKIPMPKDIDLWIQSQSTAILKLALMTMVFYNYRNKSAEIIKLLHHENTPLKIDVLNAIQNLFLAEAEDEILSLFHNESIEIQLEMLEALTSIGSEKTITFLKREIPKQEIKDVKLKMVSALDRLDDVALNNLGLQDSDTQKMINHNRKLAL